MKKYLAGALVCILALALTGCGRWGILSSELDQWIEDRGSSDYDDSYDDYGDYDDYGGYGDYDDGESEEGQVYTGIIGETMSSYFFDFTVESVEQVDAFDGYTPSDGMILLDALIDIVNTDDDDLPMSIYDFQIQYGDFGDDEYGYEVEALWDSDLAMPEHYTLAEGDSCSMHVVYEVPESSLSSYYAIDYLEEFTDGTEGDMHAVIFSMDTAGSTAAEDNLPTI